MTPSDPMPDYIQLGVKHLDDNFQQRWAQVHRAAELAARGNQQAEEEYCRLVIIPWVTRHPFRPNTGTHCPHGHSHNAEVVGVESFQDHPHMRRKCRHCPDWWLEPVDAVL